VTWDAYKRERVRTFVEDYCPARLAETRTPEDIVYERDIHMWMDGSVEHNGRADCTAGSAWVSDLGFDDCVQLTGSTLSNNVAEVAVVVLCLLAWRDAHVVIHTDSTFVLGLARGGLLAMERDGWGDTPWHLSHGAPTCLLQHLLFLLWSRTGHLTFTKAKAHRSDVMNNKADALANRGRVSGRLWDISALMMPKGWVDMTPVLCHQPLDYITKLTIRRKGIPPTATVKFRRFLDRWVVTLGNMFGRVLDPGDHVGKVWRLNIPKGLKEVLWKEMNGTLVIGHRYHGMSDMGRSCRCGAELSLGHMLMGCAEYKQQGLMDVLLDRLRVIGPVVSLKTLWPDEWGVSGWYPLLALSALELNAIRPSKSLRKPNRALQDSRPAREWLIGSYFWMIWKWRMKEIHAADFRYRPENCGDAMGQALKATPPGTNPVDDAARSDGTMRVKTGKTDGAYT